MTADAINNAIALMPSSFAVFTIVSLDRLHETFNGTLGPLHQRFTVHCSKLHPVYIRFVVLITLNSPRIDYPGFKYNRLLVSVSSAAHTHTLSDSDAVHIDTRNMAF